MNSKVKHERWMLMFVWSGLLLAPAACRRPEANPPVADTREKPTVTVSLVETGDVTQVVSLTGDIRAWATVVLGSKVPGRLERLGIVTSEDTITPVTEGTLVRRGAIVAQVDRAVYEARLRQAEAAAAMAEAQYQDAVREEKRALALFQDGSLTEQARDKAITARMVAEAAQSQARAAVTLARIEFEESSVKSPLDGIVSRRHLDEGNLVSVGTPILTIEDTSRVKVLFAVPERYLPSIIPGTTGVRVSSDTLDHTWVEAVVVKVFPTVDPISRTGMAEAHLDNPDGRFRPGSFVRVLLNLSTVRNTPVIPYSAITWQGQDAFVFVVQNGKAHYRPIRVGIREGEKCQVLDGLRPGESLVVEGFRLLRDGDEVVVREVLAR
ncbi:MAG: efflux RND transporter periplasmic adaptor subunit [Kiritimatiellae bacterium]|nr:efflux RND transporter periplasmic adaptor subunit [Kiritimatiellia bacterium]